MSEPLYVCDCNPDMPVSELRAIAHAAQTAAWAARQMEGEQPPEGLRLRLEGGRWAAEGHRPQALSQEESDRIRATWKDKRCQHCGADEHCTECCLYGDCKRAEAAMWYVQQQMIEEGRWPDGVPTGMSGPGWKGSLHPDSEIGMEWQRRAIELIESSPDCRTGEIRVAIERFAVAEPAITITDAPE